VDGPGWAQVLGLPSAFLVGWFGGVGVEEFGGAAVVGLLEVLEVKSGRVVFGSTVGVSST